MDSEMLHIAYQTHNTLTLNHTFTSLKEIGLLNGPRLSAQTFTHSPISLPA